VDIIGDCLASLKAQTYPNIEIIGVDAESTDGTAQVMAESTALYCFHIESFMSWGTPYQVVWGASKAKGKYLYFVDSDMVLVPKAIETYVVQMEVSGANALIVPEISFGQGFWAKCKVIERSAYLLGDSTIEAPRFMQKTMWDEVGGYNPEMGGLLDWDFHKRIRGLGKQIIRGSTPVYHNEGHLTLRKLVKKKYTYGKTAGVYLQKHWKNKDVASSQFNLFRPVYFRNWRTYVKDPLHTAGFIVMKLVEGTAFSAGLLRNRLRRRQR
jgi:glycosyltransferase involved in cell wall biosynthesis